jgi:hypothetical protein
MLRRTVVAAVLMTLIGSGCSFRPVYGDYPLVPNATSMAFNFASPHTRLEQIVYHELALRFPISTVPGTPELRVSVSAGHPRQGIVSETYEANVIATAVITLNGRELFSATRVATAQYSVASSQVLAHQSARQEAEERATKSAADSLRLSLLSEFSQAGGYQALLTASNKQ